MICVGCDGPKITLGPTTETEYIVAHPGQPAKVVENRKVKVLPESAKNPVEQDIGGWVVMPQSHFDALMRSIDKKENKVDAEIELPPPKKVGWFNFHYLKARTITEFPEGIRSAASLTMGILGIQAD